MSKNKDFKLNLNNENFSDFLNFILHNINEDRDMALENYALLNVGLEGTTNLEVGSLEHMMAVNDLSESMERFLNNSSESTDKLIKLAKLQFDMLKIMSNKNEHEYSEEELANLRELAENFIDSDDGDV
jgi:hypothetical protein